MSEQSYFMGLDGFVWFVGVVEDRNDPDALGRVRVRCVGFHTEDISALPTTDLPWAHVMHPVTDPSMHGMGSTPSFLVEGSYVIGFFRDAGDKQQPIIIGSLPGNPSSAADPRSGFNDPRGIDAIQTQYKGDPVYGPYPVDGDTYTMSSGHEVGESDTNRLAQGLNSENHSSLITRRAMRLSGDPTGDGNGIPIATKPNLSAVSDVAAAETRGFWEELHPKGHSATAKPYPTSQYPYNHVHESESGHIHEIDDSPEAERLFTQHKSGTFEELHTNGDKVVKVIGDNYEIIAGGSNVSITGNVNLTVEGTVREYIKGDYHLEVEGDYTQKIGGNIRTKVGYKSGGNVEEEINGNHGYTIKGAVKGNVGPLSGAAGPGEGDVDIKIVGSETHVIGNNLTLHASADTLLSAGNDIMITASSNMNVLTTSGIMSIKSGSDIDIRSATAMLLKSETNMTVTVGGTYTETISGIAGIKYNADATFQYVNTLKEKIDGDHFIDKETGFTDHNHPISPARSSGTTAIASL
jgi:hypothetical protein